MAHIFIIAGHGAGDPGAVGNGYTEAERVRALSKRIAALGGNNNVTLGDINRDYYADNGISSLTIPKDWQIVELHMDSAPATARGGHVIIKDGFDPDVYDNALADYISGIFPGRAKKIVGRNDLANPSRAANRGYSYRLIECGFITNAEDVRTFNNRMDEIAKGILKCFAITVQSASNTSKKPEQKPGNVVNENGLHYRAHSQSVGTLTVVRDGQIAGLVGYGKRMEALWVDIRTLRKQKGFENVRLSAKVHIQSIGWEKYDIVEHDTTLGTTGRHKRIEAIELELAGLPEGKKLYFRTHVAGTGWTPWVLGGFTSGTVGLSKGIEAIQIKVE